MSHTQESWSFDRYNHMVGKTGRDIVIEGGTLGRGEEAHANALRIVSCINACAGLNPSAYRECLEALRDLYENELRELRMTDGEVSGGMMLKAKQALAHAQESSSCVG